MAYLPGSLSLTAGLLWLIGLAYCGLLVWLFAAYWSGLLAWLIVTMVTMGGDLQPGSLADRLLTGLGQPQINP
jgi:hypothetical protein